MMDIRKTILAVLVVVILVGMSGMFYTVAEYEQAVITQFGRPIHAVTDAGLHVKVPFIQKATRYEKRILRWDGEPKEVPTRDKRFIWVDVSARWRITDPVKFLRVIGTYEQAYAKLDDIIDSVVKDYVSSNLLVELIRTTDIAADGEAMRPGVSPQMKAQNIKMGRENITRAILEEASKAMPDFGMELVDVRIKRVNYVERVQQKVYERMISERKRQAAQFRSEGEGQKAKILGQMEKELKGINSEAFKIAEETRGKADAEAAAIYGDVYTRDAEFYSFYKTLETYRVSGFENATLILGTDADYYSILKKTKR